LCGSKGLALREKNVMQMLRIFMMLALMSFGVFQIAPSHAGFGDFLRSVKKAVDGDEGLSESKMIDGLKEALQIGTGNAVETVSQMGGTTKTLRSQSLFLMLFRRSRSLSGQLDMVPRWMRSR
jgi:hypothetical protein